MEGSFRMKPTIRKAFALSLTAILAVPATAFATHGYFLIGYGAKSRSMGGVGTAFPQDGLAAAANPASMSALDIDTMRIDAGGEIFRPKRGFVHDSATLESGFKGSDKGVEHESGSNMFLIPSMGGVYKFNRKMTMGMAVIGNGANTRYHQDVPGKPDCMDGQVDEDSGNSDGTGSTAFNFNCLGSANVGVQLLQMQMLPSVSYKVNKSHSVGASLAIGVQQFRAYGLQSFGLDGLGYTDGENLTNKGNDYAYGAGMRFGWLGQFFDKRLSLGANYASKVYMTRFKDYEDLFAEQGKFDIPAHWSVGLAFKATDKITIAADYQKIYYSDVASINNPGPDPKDPFNFFPDGCKTIEVEDGPPKNTCMLGRDDGMGFGWSDANVYKIGINYDHNDQWSFRVGYNYAEAPMDDDQVLFNFLAPAVVEHHATLGLSYRPNRNMEWSANYMHAFSNSIKGPTALGPKGGLPVDGENASIDMRINSFGISFAYMM